MGTGWQVNLRDPSLTRAISKHLRGELLVIKRYTNRHFTLYEYKIVNCVPVSHKKKIQLECGPMPNVMVALPNIGGALRSTPQSLADAHY